MVGPVVPVVVRVPVVPTPAGRVPVVPTPVVPVPVPTPVPVPVPVMPPLPARHFTSEHKPHHADLMLAPEHDISEWTPFKKARDMYSRHRKMVDTHDSIP